MLPICMLNPLSLNVALGLACIQEEYLASTKKSLKMNTKKGMFQ